MQKATPIASVSFVLNTNEIHNNAFILLSEVLRRDFRGIIEFFSSRSAPPLSQSFSFVSVAPPPPAAVNIPSFQSNNSSSSTATSTAFSSSNEKTNRLKTKFEIEGSIPVIEKRLSTPRARKSESVSKKNEENDNKDHNGAENEEETEIKIDFGKIGEKNSMQYLVGEDIDQLDREFLDDQHFEEEEKRLDETIEKEKELEEKEKREQALISGASSMIINLEEGAEKQAHWTTRSTRFIKSNFEKLKKNMKAPSDPVISSSLLSASESTRNQQSSSSSSSSSSSEISLERIQISACIIRQAIEDHHVSIQTDRTARALLKFKYFPLVRITYFVFLWCNIFLQYFEAPDMNLPFGLSQFFEAFFLLIILVDLLIDLRIQGVSIWTRRVWNIARFVGLLAILIEFVIVTAIPIINKTPPTSNIRITRMFRVVFLVEASNPLKTNVGSVISSTLAMFEVMIHILLHVMFFSILGYSLFGSNPNDPYFQTFFDSFLNLFICLTTANFPDILIPAFKENSFSILFFVVYLVLFFFPPPFFSNDFLSQSFLFLQVFGIYAIVNRAIAIVYNHYRTAAKTNALKKFKARRKALVIAFRVLDPFAKGTISKEIWVRVYRAMETVHERNWENHAEQLFDRIGADGSGIISVLQFLKLCDQYAQSSSIIHKIMRFRIPESISSRVNRFRSTSLRLKLENRYVEILMASLVLLNAVLVVATVIYPDDAILWWRWTAFSIDTALLLIFLVELVLRFIGFGLIDFWKDKWNLFDFFIIGFAIASKIAEPILEVTIGGSKVGTAKRLLQFIRLVRILRITRSVRLFSVSRRLQVIVSTYLDLIIPLSYFSVIVFLDFCVFANIGMKAFNGVLSKSNSMLTGTYFSQSQYYEVVSFDYFRTSMFSCFRESFFLFQS